jgi:hypothetical protein
MTMSLELEMLFREYAEELRQSKEFAERWWRALQERESARPGPVPLADLWPMGPVSHPRVIATYRKYYFRCVELNAHVRQGVGEPLGAGAPVEDDWGSDDDERIADTVEPRTFVLDLLAGGETNDLYEFMLALVFVPIGMKGDVVA